MDPASPYHESHRPPVIDSVRIITDCAADLIAYTCSFEARTYVSDPDKNLLYDSVFARLDTFELGPMSYDPQHATFILRRSQADFPQNDLYALRFRPFRVTIMSEYDVRDSVTVLFPAVQLDWPDPDHPVGEATYPDTVYNYVARTGWLPWGDFDGRYTYSMALYLNESTLVWDTSGISAADTAAVIGDSLQPSWIIRYPYKWYLTVVDELGNRMTARPQYFLVYPEGPLPVLAPNLKTEEVD